MYACASASYSIVISLAGDASGVERNIYGEKIDPVAQGEIETARGERGKKGGCERGRRFPETKRAAATHAE